MCPNGREQEGLALSDSRLPKDNTAGLLFEAVYSIPEAKRALLFERSNLMELDEGTCKRIYV